jgi:hypothetical protein
MNHHWRSICNCNPWDVNQELEPPHNHFHNHLSSTIIQQIAQKRKIKPGVKGWSHQHPHQFWHTYIDYTLQITETHTTWICHQANPKEQGTYEHANPNYPDNLITAATNYVMNCLV